MLIRTVLLCAPGRGAQVVDGDRAGDCDLQAPIHAFIKSTLHEFPAMPIRRCHLDGFTVDEQHLVLIDAVMQRRDELSGQVEVEFGCTSIVEHRVHAGSLRWRADCLTDFHYMRSRGQRQDNDETSPNAA